MKHLVGLLLALAVVWLAFPKGGEREKDDELVKSSRRVLDERWRSKPEREMTIKEMESYAAGLSDEKLWGEFKKSAELWLEITGPKTWKNPPRLSVMLAREIGRRDGESGLMMTVAFLEEMEKGIDSQNQDAPKRLDFLGTNLSYAVFGGWSSKDPDEAISCVLEKVNFKRDPFEGKGEEEVFPLGFVNRSLVNGIPLFASERVVREAFRRLAVVDVERAKDLLSEGGINFVFDPNQMVEAILGNLDDDQKSQYLAQLASTKAEGFEGFKVFDATVWSNDIATAAYAEEVLSNVHWMEVLARARPEMAVAIIRDSQIGSEKKDTLFHWLVYSDPQHLELLREFPPESQMALIDSLIWELDGFRFGPIDGKNAGFMPSWEKHFGALEKIVESSNLSADKKALLQSRILEVTSDEKVAE